jgi:hypothetical protein
LQALEKGGLSPLSFFAPLLFLMQWPEKAIVQLEDIVTQLVA